jgi:hypothetical protein
MSEIDPNVTPPPAVPPPIDPRLLVREEGLKGYLTEFQRKIRGGDLGSLPVIVGLVIIWIVFSLQDSNYLTSANFEYIAYYMVGIGLLSIGLVFVLLLGEIDLSVGSVRGALGEPWRQPLVHHGDHAAHRRGHRRAARLRLRQDRRPGLRGHPGRIHGLAGLHALAAGLDRHHQPADRQRADALPVRQLLLHGR